MLPLITLYGLAPVLVGNAVGWPLYLRLRKTHPLPERKTLQQAILEAAQKSGGKVARRTPEEEPPQETARRSSPEEDAMLLYGSGDEDAG